MIKKIISFVVLTVMVFSLVACSQVFPQSNRVLVGYKDDAKNAIEAYAEVKKQETNISDKMFVFKKIVSEGKATVDAAKTKKRIDKAVDSAKQAMDDISKDGYVGIFYELQEAYSEGLLTKEDLQTIANYHKNGGLQPGSLKSSIASSIKKAWAERLRVNANNSMPKITAEHIIIDKYYGTYNNCAIVMLDCNLFNYAAVYMPITLEVDGVLFHFGHPRYKILAWKY